MSLNFDVRWDRRTVVGLLVFCLVGYLGLWVGEWQSGVPISALRVLIAFVLWLAPGWLIQQLVWRGEDITVSQRLAVSFGVAVTLTGLVGFTATAFHLSLDFVRGALAGVTCVGMVALAARHGWQWTHTVRPRINRADVWSLVPVGIALGLVIWLTSRLAAITDDLSFNAYLANWQYAPHYSWNEIFFGIPELSPARFWLAFWTLNEALISRTAAVHGLYLVQFYFSPLLALVSLTAAYALARAFDMTRAYARFVVVAQTAAFLLLTDTDQVGGMFFNRIVEDRVIAALLLLPIFGIAVTLFLKRATINRAFITACCGAALVLTHSVSTGLAVGIIGLYVVLDYVVRRKGRAVVMVLGLLALMLAVLLALRFMQPEYADKIVFGVDDDLLREGQLRRIVEFGNGLLGVPIDIIVELPYVWTAPAAGLALMQLSLKPLGTGFAARWLVVTTLVIASVVIPLTAPLWTVAIPAAQLWRVTWIAPFGIAAAYAVQSLSVRFAPRVAVGQAWRAGVVLPVVALLLLGGAYGETVASGNINNLHTIRLTKLARGNYADLIALEPTLRTQLAEPTVIVGGDKWLNDRLPALTANARVMVFRSTRNMWQLGNMTQKEAKARTKDWRRLTRKKTTVADRIAVLQRYNARWVVADKNTAWVEALAGLPDPPIRPFATQGDLVLYRIQP